MSLWTQAKAAALQTPATRNRAADFFRAAAILLVVFGHWIVSVPHFVDGELRFTELLAVQPWTQYATWVVQVMPVFFFVGGFSNAVSWASARRDPAKHRAWQGKRLTRLLRPLTPLILLWAAAAAVAAYAGLEAGIIRDASRAALIPVWFLAVYIMVTLVVPLTTRAWERWGLWSVVALFTAAGLVDLIAFAGAQGWLRWANYGFVWLGVHQMGYWWHRGIEGRAVPALVLAAGLGLLWLLLVPLGYPVAMVSVPGEEISNTRPPTLAMLAVGLTQIGAILLLAGPVSAWLRNTAPWAAVILISRRIMTVYLWHLTALLILVGLSLLADGFGLKMTPGSALWWWSRPLWIAVMLAALFPLIFLFGTLESGSRRAQGATPGAVRAVLGAVLACAGLTFLALGGTYGDNLLGMNVVPVVLALAGVQIATIGAPAGKGGPRPHGPSS
jgi:hypothetical protein